VNVSSLRFFRLASPVCGPRHNYLTVHAGPTWSCVAVSLSRDVPLPAVEPSRNWARSAYFAFNPAALVGFVLPFAVFPACGSRRL